ncbi:MULTISPECIES: MFS transporter [Streptomyces]|uniref:MFS transporter n=1 Tax=Streptomyces evansiae TaxID=3075535 RepID=A0ABU2QYK7_9ACTN|nr:MULTISPECIES: MFS transporter [unclassified Streptomyces]MDT0408575.1 MFS transporter [Streptomyces sp. DSM 41979]MYQ58689.1 MFS transporter [Streptomyces sp. SID4926]SCE29058.1 Major Facilitator Superfamily protein [Streptomyces sp. DfronAA-171]
MAAGREATGERTGGRGGRGAGKGRAGRREEPRTGLWTRDFGLFFTARAVAKLGDTMLPVALAAGLLQEGYGAGAVGLAMASSVALFAGLVIFGGVIADRFDTRKLMTGADSVRVLTQSVAALLFFTGSAQLWQICVIGGLNGIASALFQPGVASTVPRLAADVQKTNGAVRVAESVAALLGPAFAGMLVGLASPGAVFLVHAGTYLVSALCLITLRLPAAAPRAETAAPSRFRADLVEGWHEFRSRVWLWGVISVWGLYMVAAWGPTVPLVATRVVDEHGAGAYGLINTALGAGTVLGGLIALRLRPLRMLRAGAIAFFSVSVFPAAVGAGLPVPGMAAGAFVAGVGTAFWGVMWATTVQTQVRPEVLNRIHAYDVAGSLALLPVGQALAGPAASLFGTDAVLLAGGVVILVCGTVLLLVPGIRRLPRAEPRLTPAASGGTLPAQDEPRRQATA